MLYRRFIFIAVLAALPFLGIAQEGDSEEPNTLENQYLQLKNKSNSYQQYKVVDKTKLDGFWSAVEDTLNENSAQITGLDTEVVTLKKTVSSLETKLIDRDSSLSDQSYQIEHMSFLGIDMTKGGYITFSWVIIFVLILTVLILYFRFSSANKTTKGTKKDFSQLQEDFDEHKRKTRDKETKLMRDLQTEINRVEELKGKLGEG
ncbi:MAG: septal ring factor EnvC (AmiA/AmiB activator) [Cryomorphaceae bacterium]|jgi:septal ring factor EnvC (AmiA/AmiB activator)